jgi:tripeptidyl-peptidase-1
MDEVHELVKPADETLDLVTEWLLLNGIKNLHYSPAKDWINIYIDVESAERLLDTEYSVFQHEDGEQLVRTSQWSLPTHLHDLIDTVQPTTSFMRVKGHSTDSILFKSNSYTPPGYKPPTNESISQVCDFNLVNLECLKTLYGTLSYKQKAAGINQIGFNNYLNSTPVRPDVNVFLQKYNPPAAPEAFVFKSVSIAGGLPARDSPLTPAEAQGVFDGTNDFRVGEANLDSQTILGMTFPAPVTSFSTGGSPPFQMDLATTRDTNEPYLTWVTFVSGEENLPQVISSSYGDDEQTG